MKSHPFDHLRSPHSRTSPLTAEARRWWRWIIAALVAFWAGAGIAIARFLA